MYFFHRDEFDLSLLFSPINPDEDEIDFGRIELFESYLGERKFIQDEVYGQDIFKKEITICLFFDSKNNESILADIEQKNKKQNMGNMVIPNTKIKLINYSICPKCKTIFSYKDLINYYKNPKPDLIFKNKGHQVREDTRICCYECDNYFLPALVISDGTPKNEVQFLCKMQTVEAIERYFIAKDQKVLSKNPKNVIKENNFTIIRNDVPLQQMQTKPTLITNLLQYTPIYLIPNLIDGTNIEKGDMLFGKWNLIDY